MYLKRLFKLILTSKKWHISSLIHIIFNWNHLTTHEELQILTNNVFKLPLWRTGCEVLGITNQNEFDGSAQFLMITVWMSSSTSYNKNCDPFPNLEIWDLNRVAEVHLLIPKRMQRELISIFQKSICWAHFVDVRRY